jgi:hypothetical protein
MARSTIIRHVTEALLAILRKDLATPPTAIIDPANIKAVPPESIEGVGTQTLIVYLYQVIESPFLKNVGPRTKTVPPSPIPVVQKDPLALELYYLLIPGAGVMDDAYLDTYDILGAAMRSFHDHGTFVLGDWAPAPFEDEKSLQFRIDFNRLETADLIRIWEAVHEPYRLSVSYVVRTVQIDSALEADARLVSRRQFQFDQR